jgi:hypothetical protein
MSRVRSDLDSRRRVDARRAVINAHIECAMGKLQCEIESGWLGHEHSPLGRLAHVAAVRRRIAEGRRDAAIHGGRYLLTIDALVDEVFETTRSRLTRAVRALRRAPAQNDNARRCS